MSLTSQSPPLAHAWLKRFYQQTMDVLLWLSPWAGAPKSDDSNDTSHLQVQLLNAGLRSNMALPVFLGFKTFLTLLLPSIFIFSNWFISYQLEGVQYWLCILVASIVGYYLPNFVLKQMVQKQQKILFHSFPDALDLMRLCVQAGLGLDAAVDRVGREMRFSYPELSDEFALTGLELRAGSSRAEALRHLSQRMGLPDIEGLVSMLIQADRFGSSIAESLEVHSDALRTKRRLIAEEAAAKLPIKLLIPLIFCVFPALMTVLLGPVVISITQQLFPLVNN